MRVTINIKALFRNTTNSATFKIVGCVSILLVASFATSQTLLDQSDNEFISDISARHAQAQGHAILASIALY